MQGRRPNADVDKGYAIWIQIFLPQASVTAPNGTVVTLCVRFRAWCELKLHKPQHFGVTRQVHRHPAGIYKIS